MCKSFIYTVNYDADTIVPIDKCNDALFIIGNLDCERSGKIAYVYVGKIRAPFWLRRSRLNRDVPLFVIRVLRKCSAKCHVEISVEDVSFKDEIIELAGRN